MNKLKTYFASYTKNPNILVEYIWFSLCYYFGRRGREGWRKLKKSTFEVRQDDKSRQYIAFKITEQTKNHQGGHRQVDQDYSDQRIYETSAGELCPIKAYNLYKSKLHPLCTAFFQTPLSVYEAEGKWFKNEPMGKNKLSTIMQRISKKAGLSEIYTCHSVRASTVTNLGHAGVDPGKICKITKHKNEASLKPYLTNLSNNQKKECTDILQQAFTPAENRIEMPMVLPPQPQYQPVEAGEPSTSTAIVAQHLPDGSYAVTLPAIPPPSSTIAVLPPVNAVSENINSCSNSDLKCLQNLLPNCQFSSCTININTTGQQSH